MKLCTALGLARDYVLNAEPLPGVKFAVDTFALMATKSWLLGISVSEGEDTAQGMVRDIEIFRKYYSWVPEQALEFYRLHSEVDVGHASIRLDILAKYCDNKELQEDCINGQLTKNNIRRVMTDAIYMAYVVQKMTCGNGVG